jgi:hypothetical protein
MENLSLNPALLKSPVAKPSTSKAKPEVISRAIQMLFSAYRRDDFTDAEGFVAQLGVILTDFPEEVVTYVTGPRTGIQRRSKWPPTISEIVEACESHQDYLARVRRARPSISARLPSPRLDEAPQGHLANLHVPADHPRYANMVEWSKSTQSVWWKLGKSSDGADGIWIPLDVWHGNGLNNKGKRDISEGSIT